MRELCGVVNTAKQRFGAPTEVGAGRLDRVGDDSQSAIKRLMSSYVRSHEDISNSATKCGTSPPHPAEILEYTLIVL